ncbi:hypothetical protein Pmani_030436 [Petrolisthes manimaculis]|uniref:PCNA-associated factor n=1 Tax=Petrolisthes manimaculis TaxID=1843537 RepID=A0AAE1NXJ1_9EUCA|nr:hypothetical protein Pmani_030436 [Petrolisthes manimaculis]
MRMVRTKADAGGTKVAGAKAPRKVFNPSPAGPSLAGSPNKGNRYGGGNGYNPQPTPEWQKGIGSFFKQKPKPQVEEGSSSKSNSNSNSNSNSEDMRHSTSGGGNEGSSSGRTSPVLMEHQEEVAQGSDKGNFEKNGMVSDDDD